MVKELELPVSKRWSAGKLPLTQHTIIKPFSLSGFGLHTGAKTTVEINPAPAGHGIKFRRTDMAGKPIIEAVAENVVDTARGTTIGFKGATVSTIEHLLAAVSALGIDNLLIDINAVEVPILDGSAIRFVNALKSAGTLDLGTEREFYTLTEDISYEETLRDVLITGSPFPGDQRFSCVVDYNSQIIGVQYAELLGPDNFEAEIAPSRTFVFLHEMQTLIRHNLIKGGGLDNAVVIVDKGVSPAELKELATYFNRQDITVAPQGVLNNTRLRYPNEPARHKLLDMIGDISLVGFPLRGEIKGIRPGHAANVAFAKKLRAKILHERS